MSTRMKTPCDSKFAGVSNNTQKISGGGYHTVTVGKSYSTVSFSTLKRNMLKGKANV